jgi:hypothetical protein
MKRLKLPSRIIIDLIDLKNQPVKKANVMFGLRIFTTKDSCHNWSPLYTNAEGKIEVFHHQIIENTELKWEQYNEYENTLTKAEIYAWDNNLIDSLSTGLQGLMRAYADEENVRRQLSQFGFQGKALEVEYEKVKSKATEDRYFANQVALSQANKLIFENNLMTDYWELDQEYVYSFKVKSNST